MHTSGALAGNRVERRFRVKRFDPIRLPCPRFVLVVSSGETRNAAGETRPAKCGNAAGEMRPDCGDQPVGGFPKISRIRSDSSPVA